MVNSQESFSGKPGENVDSFFQEFLVTHSEEILVTLSKEFLVTNSREFLVTNSWEFPWNYSQDFPRVPQEYLEIFTNKSSELLNNYIAPETFLEV